MSGRLEHINQRKRHGNNSRSGNLAAWRESKKKAKLLMAEPHRPGECITCGQIPRDDHRTICGLCGYKNSTIDTSKLDLSGHLAVNQVRFGKDSLKDSDYQAVLGMLPEDIGTDYCSYFVQECRSGNVVIIPEEL